MTSAGSSWQVGSLVDGLGHDVRLGWRTLWATRTVSALAAVSLALGIGGTTAIFSLVNSLILHSLPVDAPERLVVISSATAVAQKRTPGWTYRIWNELRQRADVFDGALAWSAQQQFRLTTPAGDPQRLDGFYVSGTALSTLGVPAVVGRTFTDADDVRGGGRDGAVALISYGFWQRRFGRDAAVIGRSVVLERVPFTIIGVTPPAFFGLEVGQGFDVLLPIGTEPLIRGKDTLLDRPLFFLRLLLRLKPGQSFEAASAALTGLQPQIRDAARPASGSPRFLQEFLKERFVLVSAEAGTSRLRERYTRPLLTILVVVAVVLVVACANIGNLLLARAAARRQELSVRLAIGASRWRLARQLLVESFLLAAVSACVGLALATWGSRALVAQLSNYFDRVFLDVSPDWSVLAFTLAVTVTAALLFGTLPALRATRVAPFEALREQGRTSVTRGGVVLSSGLVVVQLALSLVLVVAAGLFVRTFDKLASVPLGFESERVLIVYADMKHAQVQPTDRVAFYGQIGRALGAVPGVAGAAVSMVTPVSGLTMTDVMEAAQGSEMSQSERTVLVNLVTPGWFAAYGTKIVAGRDFSEHNTKGAPPVVVVNEAFARKFFQGRNAIGETIASASPAQRAQPAVRKTIVGVVGDTIYRSLRDAVQPTVYASLAQADVTPASFSVSIRSVGPPPAALQRDVAAALNAVDRNLEFEFLPLVDQLNASLVQERIVAVLAGFFGTLALLLAALGLYGVTAYSVSRRRTELGIRLALGAAPARVIWLTVWRVLTLVVAGVAIGLGAGVWLGQFVATLLFGLPASDPLTFAQASAILGVVALLACWLPAWRASRLDPVEVLRSA